MRTRPESSAAARPEADDWTPPPSGPGAIAAGLLQTARPKQWVKNVLVLAAPVAAGKLFHADVIGPICVAFVAFCLAASGTYFLNDVLDRERDRVHRTKRNRPIASGVISPQLGTAVGVILLVAAIAISIPINDGILALTLLGYIVLTVSYSLWLKHEPVIDLAGVAAGFVIRAIAGGAATGIPISNWFLIVASFGALFIVTGKRHAESLDLADEAADHRRVLAAYSVSYLNYVRAVTSGVCITAYCLWAFEKADAVTNGTEYWFKLSIVPFVLAILRYALLVEHGEGGAPEELVLSDRVLLVLGAIWIVVFGLGVRLK